MDGAKRGVFAPPAGLVISPAVQLGGRSAPFLSGTHCRTIRQRIGNRDFDGFEWM